MEALAMNKCPHCGKFLTSVNTNPIGSLIIPVAVVTCPMCSAILGTVNVPSKR